MTSVFEDILDAVASAARAVVDDVRVLVRKDEVRWSSDELPLILVDPGTDRDVKRVFGNEVIREYQVFLALVWPGNRKVEGPFGDVPGTKQAVKRALDTEALAGVPEVFGITLPGRTPLYEPAGLPANYERSVLEVLYRTAEVRSE